MTVMIENSSQFFVAGGTVPATARCYLERDCDRQLRNALKQREYCYVLTSRQMGKSSLMARTAAFLRTTGARVVTLDLTLIGRNLSVEQWYYGLLTNMGRQLGMQAALREFWITSTDLGPLQRWTAAIEQVILPALHEEEGSPELVIFVDEIDYLLSLPFSATEFLAGIRQMHNGRNHSALLEKISFCLLGVASPAELIHDSRITPFSVGRRIELTDFSRSDLNRLAEGLRPASSLSPDSVDRQLQRVLDRIMHWTAGHPYLTQRLAQAVAESGEAASPELVDRLCTEILIRPGDALADDNLIYVQDYLLRDADCRVELLKLYERIVRRRFVPVDLESPLITSLRLAGVVRIRSGRLVQRNRIYSTVFNEDWIDRHLPEFEVRRQRSNYRRSFWTAVGLGSLLVTLFGGIAASAVLSARRAHEAEVESRRLAQQRLEALNAAREMRYVANISAASSALRRGETEQARTFLLRERTRLGSGDLRGPEWGLLWNLAEPARRIAAHDRVVLHVEFAQAGQIFSASQSQASLHRTNGRIVRSLIPADLSEARTALEPSGRWAAVFDSTRRRLWIVNTATGSEQQVDDPRLKHIARLAPAGPGWFLLIAQNSGDGISLLLHARDRALRPLAPGLRPTAVHGPRGLALTRTQTGDITVSDAGTGAVLARRRWFPPYYSDMHIDTTGSRLLAVSERAVAQFELPSLRLIDNLQLTGGRGGPPAQTPGGRLVAFDLRIGEMHPGSRIQLWRPGTGKPPQQMPQLENATASIALSTDGTRLVTGGWDHTVRLWNLNNGSLLEKVKTLPGPISELTIGTHDTLALISKARLHVGTVEGPLSTVQQVDPATSVRISTSGRLIAAHGRRDLLILNPRGEILGRYSPQTTAAEIRAVSLAPSDTEVAVILSAPGRFWLQRLRPDGLITGPPLELSETPMDVAYLPKGELVVASITGLSFYSARGQKSRPELALPCSKPIAVSSNGKMLGVPSLHHDSVFLIHLDSGRRAQRLPVGREGAYRLYFSSGGETLITSSRYGSIRFWRAPSGELLHDFSGVKPARLSGYSGAEDTFWLYHPNGQLLKLTISGDI